MELKLDYMQTHNITVVLLLNEKGRLESISPLFFSIEQNIRVKGDTTFVLQAPREYV